MPSLRYNRHRDYPRIPYPTTTTMCLAVPGQLIALDEADGLLRCGRVKFGGIVKTVSLACVPEARVGDYVLVHAGLAIGKVDEHEAERIFNCLRELDVDELAG